MCTKSSLGTDIFVRYNRVFVTQIRYSIMIVRFNRVLLYFTLQMSEGCDFDGDFYTKVSASSGEECAQLCREDKICTQFTYIEENGKL